MSRRILRKVQVSPQKQHWAVNAYADLIKFGPGFDKYSGVTQVPLGTIGDLRTNASREPARQGS